MCQSSQQEGDENMDDEVHEVEKSEEAEDENVEQVWLCCFIFLFKEFASYFLQYCVL